MINYQNISNWTSNSFGSSTQSSNSSLVDNSVQRAAGSLIEKIISYFIG